jgi:hypothetical protein
MQVELGFVHDKNRGTRASDDMSQQLAPDLETKSCPEDLAVDAILSAEHRQSITRLANGFRRLDVHPWPGLTQ